MVKEEVGKVVRRKIIRIDEEKCDGCGLCVPACAEGALQIIDGKARLVSERYCDGLGACLGDCPQGAITIEEREAEEFNQEAVEARLQHQKEQPTPVYSHASQEPCHAHSAGCPSAQVRCFEEEKTSQVTTTEKEAPSPSALSHWPVQLKLVPAGAPFLKNADLLVVADCVPFTYSNFHQDFLEGKALVIGCPKLDDIRFYQEKLTEMFAQSEIKSVTVINVEVSCCFGLVRAVKEAIAASGKEIPFKEVTISVKGQKL